MGHLVSFGSVNVEMLGTAWDTLYLQAWGVQRCCLHVRQGRDGLHGEVQLGRPPIDLLDIPLLALLDEKLFHSVYSIADALWVSYSIVLNHLPESLGMEIFIYIGSHSH
jgi:hypothetical protein